ncbi:hypothetical protein F4811DRAFT_173875 [Daldinia bambusicola]|nr:hypothetical protein F4811DRAFT_173875 [Daldinia bambusicola]
MESRAPFDTLCDLREKYPGDELSQNYALTTQIPTRSRRQTRKLHAYSDPSDREEFALDAAIVVARHLLAAADGQYRQMKRETHLTRLLWADFSDPEGSDAQEEARNSILESYKKNPDVASVTFYSVMESKEMRDILWSLPAFQLWHPTVMAKKEGTKKWEKANIEDPARLSKEALIIYNGTGDLGEHISKKFGIFLKDGIVQCWRSNEAVAIRVFYTNTAQTAGPKKWKDLREIWVRSPGAREVVDENGDITRRFDPTGGPPKRYILLATVYLGAWKDEADRVRLYGADGEYVPLPTAALPYTGIEWRLGNPGDRYLLYYRLATLASPAGGSDLEVVIYPSGMKQKMARMKAAATLKPEVLAQLEASSGQTPSGAGDGGSGSNVGLPLPLPDTAPPTPAQQTT